MGQFEFQENTNKCTTLQHEVFTVQALELRHEFWQLVHGYKYQKIGPILNRYTVITENLRNANNIADIVNNCICLSLLAI